MHNQKQNVRKEYPQTQNSHCPQCADTENIDVVQKGVKNITKMSRRRHGAGGVEGPKAGGNLSKMAQSISWVSSLSWCAVLCISAT
jgi:hypothetical protein